MSTALQNARQQIDEIDRCLVQLLAQRQAIVDEITAVKAEADRAVKDPDREARLLDRLRRLARERNLSPDLVEALYDHILAHSVERQRKLRNGNLEAASTPRPAAPLRLVADG
jgi:chorismate mutase